METGQNFSREQGLRRNSHYYSHNGYYYHKYRTYNGTSYYRCIKRACEARGILSDGIFLETYGHGEHDPDYLHAEIRRELSRLKSLATSLNIASIDDIFNEAGNANRRFANHLTRVRLRPALYNARITAYPPEPQTLAGLDTVLKCDQYKSLCALSHFQDTVYGGSSLGGDGSCTVLFMSKRCADFMKSVSFIYGFSLPFTSNSMPHQTMHIIGTVLSNIEIPLAWIFVEKESLEAYLAAFALLRSNLIQWQFRNVICKDNGWDADAYRFVFSAVVEPSLDHFVLDVGQTARSLLGREVLHDNSDVVSIVSLCCALPILPRDLLMDAIALIKIQASSKLDYNQQSLISILLHYIQTDWILSAGRSVMFSVCGNAERTSNAIRCTSARIHRVMLGSIRGYYSFIRKVLKLENTSFKDVTDLQMSTRPMARRVVSVAEDQEIVVLTKALTRNPGTMSASILNLLRTTAEKQQLVINNVLLASDYV